MTEWLRGMPLDMPKVSRLIVAIGNRRSRNSAEETSKREERFHFR
ncbi:MAG: hypothetical protein PUP93_04760 [Rhizonema sp. NSF051]|nr:hypothetical protein [Rhizonema sp. NSF051]